VPVPLDDVATAVKLRKADLYAIPPDAPPALRTAIAKLRGKTLGLLHVKDRRIYVDASLATGRRRFTEGHEIGHDVIPWHADAYFADDEHTIAPATRAQLEQEANVFSSELVFCGDQFAVETDGYAPGIQVPLAMTGTFQTSAHATLRRYGEHSSHELALLVLGRFPVATPHGPGLPVFQEQSVATSRFIKRFGPVTELFPRPVPSTEGPVGRMINDLAQSTVAAADVTLDTRRGSVKFNAEAFSNNRLYFVLLWRHRPIAGRKLELINDAGTLLTLPRV
jgi:hypothetical protein